MKKERERQNSKMTMMKKSLIAWGKEYISFSCSALIDMRTMILFAGRDTGKHAYSCTLADQKMSCASLFH